MRNKLLLEFRLNATWDSVESKVLSLLEAFFGTSFSVANQFGSKLKSKLFLGREDEVVVLVRQQPFKDQLSLVTIDIDFGESERPTTSAQTQILTEDIKGAFSDIDAIPSWQQMPMLRLGNTQNFNSYLTTSDDRVVEYAAKSVLFDQRSKFQHVQIVDTIDHGPLLLLDGLVNLAEGDRIPYTHTLMGLDRGLEPEYGDARVLVLGGGDGALLKELLELKRAPRYVTMIDIDATVLDACSEFMPNVCGKYTARRRGDNYNVIVGDAFAEMKRLKEKGDKFDFIFGDLTDTPVLDDDDDKAFSRAVLENALGLLKPSGGRYLTHCNGKNAPEALEAFERLVDERFAGMTRTRYEAFVPSFMEIWVFYELKSD